MCRMHTLFTHQSTNSSNSTYPLPLLSNSFIAAVSSSSFKLTFCWVLHSTIAHHKPILVPSDHTSKQCHSSKLSTKSTGLRLQSQQLLTAVLHRQSWTVLILHAHTLTGASNNARHHGQHIGMQRLVRKLPRQSCSTSWQAQQSSRKGEAKLTQDGATPVPLVACHHSHRIC